ATDPVAMDHVGWDIIDAKRIQEGWLPVGRMGLTNQTPAVNASNALAGLGGQQLLDTLTLTAAGLNLHAGRESEVFDLRQPEHVILAGTIGLGEFDARRIDHRRVKLTS